MRGTIKKFNSSLVRVLLARNFHLEQSESFNKLVLPSSLTRQQLNSENARFLNEFSHHLYYNIYLLHVVIYSGRIISEYDTVNEGMCENELQQVFGKLPIHPHTFIRLHVNSFYTFSS